MFVSVCALLAASAAVASAATIGKRGQAVSVTPHDQYSSSVGVLGCKVNTNRVAYFPGAVDCNKICVKLSYAGRSVHLLKVDSSAGAHDISYDAWNFLTTGQSAAQHPTQGGGVSMSYEDVPAEECKFLLQDGKLPLSAANSMNYVSTCLQQPNSFVAKNFELFNIANAVCTLGKNEKCSLNLAQSNQPTCPGTLGLQTPLAGLQVMNVAYGTGKKVPAL